MIGRKRLRAAAPRWGALRRRRAGLLAAQDPQWNCENPQAQQEMNFCAAEDFGAPTPSSTPSIATAIEQRARGGPRLCAARGRRRRPDRRRPRRGGDPARGAARLGQLPRRPLPAGELRGARRLDAADARRRLPRDADPRPHRRAARANPDCPGDAEPAQLNQCLERQFTRADAALNRQWQETLTALPERRGAAADRAARLAHLSRRPLRDRRSIRGQRGDPESGGRALPHPAHGGPDARARATSPRWGNDVQIDRDHRRLLLSLLRISAPATAAEACSFSWARGQ